MLVSKAFCPDQPCQLQSVKLIDTCSRIMVETEKVVGKHNYSIRSDDSLSVAQFQHSFEFLPSVQK